MHNVKHSTLSSALSSWCGNEMETAEKHYEPYTLSEHPIDGKIVESVVCVETGEVFPCGPYIPLNMFGVWVHSQFSPDTKVTEIKEVHLLN